jgi:hypothetical protein
MALLGGQTDKTDRAIQYISRINQFFYGKYHSRHTDI